MTPERHRPQHAIDTRRAAAGRVARMARRASAPLLFALVVAALAVGSGAAAGDFESTGRDVFGSTAIRGESLQNFPKWRGALERYFTQSRKMQPPCESSWFASCKVQEWQNFLYTLASLPPEEKMRRVNGFHNNTRYILDIVNWSVSDYWASPQQFLDKDGDCEDYAIAKFLSLRALGFSNEQLRIVVLRDLNLRVAHAVLVVDIDGTKYVLDNQINDAVPDSVIRHYQPIYSVNETHWWLHRRG